MDSNFYNDEFEDLIRQKAGQYKMYPSDKVWKNIHSSMHTRRKWFIVGMFTLITGILFFAGKELLVPSGQTSIAKKIIEPKETSTTAAKPLAEVSITPAFLQFKVSPTSSKIPSEDLQAAGEDSMFNAFSNVLEKEPVLSAIATTDNNTQEDDVVRARRSPGFSRSDATQASSNVAVTAGVVSGLTTPLLQGEPLNSPSVNWEDKKQTSLLESRAPYELISLKKLNRKYWQLYLSPTASYRRLSGGDIYANMKTNLQNGPIAATNENSNLNQYINNKPAVGFEVGGSFLYRLTRNLSLKAGLQFNYSSYNINAYASNTQPATIALSSYFGYPTNTITSYTNIGTIGGKATVNLKNQYYQLSVPLGFELRIMGNEKLQLHVGATVQPTYLLNRNAYLLTADYTNYTQEPSLFRRWNMNGAVEAFVSYKTGSLRWQIGPQFRYQLLSTYSSKYPINENLKEFGIKIGVSKTIF